MVFNIAAVLRSIQIFTCDVNYLAELASRKSRFSSRPNPYRQLPHSKLIPPLVVKKQRYLHRLGMPLRLLLRLAHLGVIFGPAFILVAPICVFSPVRKRPLLHGIMYWCLQRAGATFIKLGQWASTRPDVLSPELCRILCELNSRAPAHGMAWNRHVFRSEFGLELEQIFQDFDCNPSGSGTVAQVHRAWLRKNGLEVAVKICHPHIEEHIERDLQLMKIMAEVAHLIPLFKNLNLPEEVVYFSQMMRQQLDLRREAYALDHFSRNFLYWKNVHVPVPVYPFVSSHVLTETFATGTTVSAFSCDSLEETLTGPEREVWTLVKTQIATIGLQSFLQMLLWDNFVHADLHPGNILVRFANRKGKVYWSDCPSKELVHLIIQEDLIPQLVYLDTGLVTQLSRRDFQNFNDLFTALVLHGDGYRAGQLIIERCPMPYRARVVDPDGFCQSMDKIIQPIFRNVSLKLKSFAIAPVIFQVFDLVRDHRVHLDGSFTNLVMSFACVEGLGRQLSPDLNLIPFLASAALQYLVTNVAFKIDQIRDNL